MDDNLSISIDMLKAVWAKFMDRPILPADEWDDNVYRPNRVKLVHPNGWYFSLGKFRNVPTEGDYRVRMHIQYKIESEDREEFRCFYPFARMFFGVDLDDCQLDDIAPILRWCEKHKPAELVKAFSQT